MLGEDLDGKVRSPDGKRKNLIRNGLQNHETQTLNCAIKTGPTVLRKLPVANLMKCEFSSKTLHLYLVVLMCSCYYLPTYNS